MSRTPYRVVQWATGNIGTKSLRAVIEHPGLELVGLYVHSADKAGTDAGELCGPAGGYRRIEAGPIFSGSHVSARQVEDGLSKTIAIGERHLLKR